MRKKATTPPAVDEAHAEREQVRQAFGAMRSELDTVHDRVEAVLERIRVKIAVRSPRLKLVKK